MTLPGTYSVDAVYLAVFAILLVPAIVNVVRHGFKRKAGFISLLIFCACRIVGNALLIDGYETNYKNSGVLIAGYILQGLGYSFLINTALALYSRARNTVENILPLTSERQQHDAASDDVKDGHVVLGNSATSQVLGGSKKDRIIRLAYALNIVALVLTIVGYTNSNIFSSEPSPSTRLDALAQAGSVVYAALTAGLIVLVMYIGVQTFRSSQARRESKLILAFLAAALPFMMARAAYFVYVYFATSPFYQHLALRIVFELVTETAAVSILTGLGFLLPREQV